MRTTVSDLLRALDARLANHSASIAMALTESNMKPIISHAHRPVVINIAQLVRVNGSFECLTFKKNFKKNRKLQ